MVEEIPYVEPEKKKLAENFEEAKKWVETKQTEKLKEISQSKPSIPIQSPPKPPPSSLREIYGYSEPPNFDIFKLLIFIGLLVIALVIIFKPFAVSSKCPDITCPSLQELKIPPCPECPPFPPINLSCGNQSVTCPKSLYYIDYSPTNEICETINRTILNITNTTCNYKNIDLNVTLIKWFSNDTLNFNFSMLFAGNGTYSFTDNSTNETYKIVVGN